MRELVKLRHRFIIILLCSVGVVIAVALAINVIGTYSTQYNRIQNSLEAAIGAQGDDELRPFIGGPGSNGTSTDLEQDSTPWDGPLSDLDGTNQEGSEVVPHASSLGKVPVYVVEVFAFSDELAILSTSANMDETTLMLALSRIESSGNQCGVFLDLGLFYLQKEITTNTTRIAFADASHLYDTTFYQGTIALLIWIVAMILFYILSLVLSRMVLKPVEVAWAKQRDFIADASHELKTPLTIILANNNIIMTHPEKPTHEQQQWLESTQEEANRMNDLVSDLLLLAQVEHDEYAQDDVNATSDDEVLDANSQTAVGGSLAVQSSLDFSALVERALLQFDAVFFERAQNAESSVEKGLHVKGNTEQLRRLVNIFLDNASKYGNEGGTVTVNLTRKATKPPSALLTITNSGPAIPPHKIDRVFDRFFRGDEAHSTAIAGSGLGLALAEEIINKHGGSVKVTSTPLSLQPHDPSNPNDDLALTTFSITLPLENA